jgi:hypothetical protein
MKSAVEPGKIFYLVDRKLLLIFTLKLFILRKDYAYYEDSLLEKHFLIKKLYLNVFEASFFDFWAYRILSFNLFI